MQYMYQNLQMTCKSHDFTSRNPEMYTEQHYMYIDENHTNIHTFKR